MRLSFGKKGLLKKYMIVNKEKGDGREKGVRGREEERGEGRDRGRGRGEEGREG